MPRDVEDHYFFFSAPAIPVHYILCSLPSSTAVTDGDCCSGHGAGTTRASSSSRREEAPSTTLGGGGGWGFLTGARSLAGEDREAEGEGGARERENTGMKENTEESGLSKPLHFFQDLLQVLLERIMPLHSLI
jgi:hypothetical protein